MASQAQRAPGQRNLVQLVPYKELEVASKNWETTLGSGSFGTVYAGTLDGVRVAIKRFHAPDNRDPFNREVAVATVVQHENLLRLLFMVRARAPPAPSLGARAGESPCQSRRAQPQRAAQRSARAAALGPRRVC